MKALIAFVLVAVLVVGYVVNPDCTDPFFENDSHCSFLDQSFIEEHYAFVNVGVPDKGFCSP